MKLKSLLKVLDPVQEISISSKDDEREVYNNEDCEPLCVRDVENALEYFGFDLLDKKIKLVYEDFGKINIILEDWE